jgi:hypothetical protein
MAATYRSSTSANTGSTPAGSLSINVPAGVAVNDVLLACVNVAGGSGATVTPPSGWVLVATLNEGTDIQMKTYWRAATGYETTSYTWTFDTTRQAAGIMAAYSGAYGFAPPAVLSAQTGTLASTTTTASPTVCYESGLVVQLFGAWNTTGATTMTANGTYTQRVDTCTTASAFVEVAAQDVAKVLPMGATTPTGATIVSQTAASIATTIVLEDQRPAFNSLAEDEFFESSFVSVTTTVTKPMTTNYPNEIVLAFINIMQDVTTVSSITTSGLTWVNVGRANVNTGSTELWRTFVATPQTFNFTITFSASTNFGNYMITGFVGADLTGSNGSGAIGAFSTAASTTAAPTVTITTTRNNSWVWGAGNDPSHTTAPVAGSNQTVLRTTSAGTSRGWMQRQNAITPASGTGVTINDTTPSVDSCNILAVEILPAVHLNLGATGVG